MGMRDFRPMARFLKGLRVDESGIKGALLEAHDCNPVRSGAGYATRGAKLTLSVAGAQAAWTGWRVKLPLFDGSLYATTDDYMDTTSGNDDTVLLPVTDAAATALAPAFFPGHPSDDAGAAITAFGATSYGSVDAASLGDELFLAAGHGLIGQKWAGKLPRTAYTTGTIAGTINTTTITGTGTSWLANARVGDYLYVDHGTAANKDRWYRIIKVVSNTSLVVDAPVDVTFTGISYRIDALAPWSVKPGTFGLLGNATTIANHSIAQLGWVCEHAGRLFGGDCVEVDNLRYRDRTRWCAPAPELSGKWKGGDYWHANAYVDVAAGKDAGTLGGISIGRTLMIFKRGSVYAFRGEVETDGRDMGATVSLVTDEDGLYGARPVPVPGGGALFAGQRGLWLLTEQGARNVTEEAGLSSLWAELVARALPVGYDFGAPTVSSLSIINDRVIVQFGRTSLAYDRSEDITDPNTLVWHLRDNLWTTQLTYLCTPIVGPGEYAMNRNPSSGVSDAYFALWSDDYDPLLSNPLDPSSAHLTSLEDGEPPLLRLTTHPVSVAGAGSMNGRLRGVQAKAALVPSNSWTDAIDALADPILWLRMGDAVGDTVVTDSSGNGRDFTATAAAAAGFGADGLIPADRDTAWRKTGVSASLSRAFTAALNPAAFTLLAWVEIDDVTESMSIFEWGNVSVGGFRLYTSGSALSWFVRNNVGGVVGGALTLTPGRYLFAMSYGGGTYNVWRNGVSIGSGAITFGANPSAVQSIGTGNQVATIDEVVMWNSQLTAPQMLALYEAGQYDPEVTIEVLLGEEGTSTSVEAAITASDELSMPEDEGDTERWYRVPVRDGSPPVDQVRVRVRQDDQLAKLIVYEAGVEVLGVGRVRP